MSDFSNFPAGAFGIAAFACDANVENTLQRLILFACADCPDPSGRPGIKAAHGEFYRETPNAHNLRLNQK